MFFMFLKWTELNPPAHFTPRLSDADFSICITGLLEDDGHSLGKTSRILAGESKPEDECWKIFFTVITLTSKDIIQV